MRYIKYNGLFKNLNFCLNEKFIEISNKLKVIALSIR